MKTFTTITGVLLGVALLLVLLAGGFFLFRHLIGLFNTLDPTIATVTAIASMVALLCAVIIRGGVNGVSRNDATLPERLKLYEQLLCAQCERLKIKQKRQDGVSDDERNRGERLLTLQGSPAVIASYAALQQLSTQAGVEQAVIVAQLAKLVLDMRKDLGQGVSNLPQQDILTLLS